MSSIVSSSDDVSSRPTIVRALSILLVDDHPVMRAGVKSLFGADKDFDVVGEADDGFAAVMLFDKLKPDVVVMDVSLPKLGGAEATKRIVQAHPGARVLGLSAHEDVSFARLLLGAGASGYALKRSAGEELVRAARVVADGGIYVDPTLAGQLITSPQRRGGTPPTLSIASLSGREAEVLRLIAHGHTSREMAETLGLSTRTLETYRSRAMSKLNLGTRAELIRYALRCGWLRST